jgi:hypothetical protein
MKHNVELTLNKAQSHLTNKLLTVALAAFTGVTCLASAQTALAQSDDVAAKYVTEVRESVRRCSRILSR